MSAPMSVLVRRAYETSRGWLALGHERVPSPHAWIVRAADVPAVYDANFAAMVPSRAGPARSDPPGRERTMGFRPLCVQRGYLKNLDKP